MQIQSKPWTRRSFLSHITGLLDAAGIEDSRRNAEWMVEEATGCSRLALYAQPDEPVLPDQVEQLAEMIARRVRREPLQYILGHADFYGLRFKVTPGVLIPRPETEQVVEHALTVLRSISVPRILDIGTGSGCIAISMKHERPDAEVFACDNSEDALRVARENALSLRQSVVFMNEDVLSSSFAAETPSELDLVISNPPYIPRSEATTLEPEVLEHEPHQALFSGDDPLTYYQAIACHALRLLKSGGRLVFESHADYASDVARLLSRAGFAEIAVLPDLSGKPRIVQGRLRKDW